MLASLSTPSSVLPLTPFRNSQPTSSPPKLGTSLASRRSQVKMAPVACETSTADYSSAFSVFPADACETVGGDACLADIFPEMKLKQESRGNNASRTTSELIDRDYLEYTEAKTVFRRDTCDVFGGEFCGRAYQSGVY